MGVTIHWNNKHPLFREEMEQSINAVKSMAQEIGFNFVETSEKGYMCSTKTTYLDGRTETDDWFVSNDSYTGNYPQMRISAIREGKPEVERRSIIVHPLGTESFAIEFIIKNDNEFVLLHGFCKTQAFSNDNPYENAQSHLWIIATLIMIKEIMPGLQISDESDFYEEDKQLIEMDEKKILDSFGENQSFIERVQKELKAEGYNTEQGTELKSEIKPEESVKSTGILEDDKHYMHTIYEKSKVLYQELLETKKQLVIRLEVPKEELKDEDNRNDNKQRRETGTKESHRKRQSAKLDKTKPKRKG